MHLFQLVDFWRLKTLIAASTFGIIMICLMYVCIVFSKSLIKSLIKLTRTFEYVLCPCSDHDYIVFFSLKTKSLWNLAIDF